MQNTPSPSQSSNKRRRKAFVAGLAGVAVLATGTVIGTSATWSDRNDLTFNGVGAADALLIDGSTTPVVRTVERTDALADIVPGGAMDDYFTIENAGTRNSLLFIGLETGDETEAGFGEYVTARILDENGDVVKTFVLDGTHDSGPRDVGVYLPPKVEKEWYVEFELDEDTPLQYAGQAIDATFTFQVDAQNSIP